MITFINIY